MPNQSFNRNASKLHKIVGNILRTSSVFNGHQIFQEYPASKLNNQVSNNRLRFDWAIPALKLVIECHGIQHYQVQSFGGDAISAISNYKDGKKRDLTKKEAALAANYTYIEIPYTLQNKLDEALLLTLIDKAKEEQKEYTHQEARQAEISTKDREYQALKEQRKKEMKEKNKEYQKEKRDEFKESNEYREKLKKDREWKREQYKKMKEKREELEEEEEND